MQMPKRQSLGEETSLDASFHDKKWKDINNVFELIFLCSIKIDVLCFQFHWNLFP